MKYFFAITAFALAILVVKAQLTEKQEANIRKYLQECSKESGVDSEVVANARHGQFSDDSKLKKHLFCVAKKIGMINDAGEYQKDVMYEKVSIVTKDRAIAQKLVDMCSEQKGTPEETAFESIKCYYSKIPQHLKNV